MLRDVMFGVTGTSANCRQKIDYCLTEAAIELVPLMAHLGAWGSRWLPTSPALSIRAHLLAEGGPEMWVERASAGIIAARRRAQGRAGWQRSPHERRLVAMFP
ncbi:hypothetical protein [Micromonospora sp. NPDC005707]|uniref:hypothetical protein n=1 Tax=Micromonospora sp. NPDC005707 TaxID=3157050 RepID=UPI0033CC6EEF